VIKIIKELEEELKNVEEKYFYADEDFSKENPGEVIGDLTDQEIRMIALINKLIEQIEEAHNASGFAPNDEEHKKAIQKRNRLSYKLSILRDILWVVVSDRLGIWDKDDLAFRKDFKIVSRVRDPDEDEDKSGVVIVRVVDVEDMGPDSSLN
jgi:hypothetical protein